MSKPLFIDLGGRIACDDHGGFEFQAARKAKPRARKFTTGLTAWERLTEAEVKAYDLDCERCARQEANA